jgi:coenzyme F420-reducing hydrogenase delta subunit
MSVYADQQGIDAIFSDYERTRRTLMDQKSAGLNITIFFCQQLDPNQDVNRRALERELGKRIRFFPLPCSGRIDSLHVMRALEAGADKVYVVTCPEGACHYREGNVRAKKRIAYTQGLIEEIGLERERLELIVAPAGAPVTVDELARAILARKASIGPSPVRGKQA